MIYYLTPFSPEKRLGHIHNENCKIVPNNDDWICLMDPDVLFLHPHQQAWINAIIKSQGHAWDLLGCMTNRIGVKEQLYGNTYLRQEERDAIFNEQNVKDHLHLERDCRNVYGSTIIETTLIAGFCMIFKKSLWNKIKFREGINFDIKFCEDVKNIGGRIGIMKGIYIFHSYRLGSEDPQNDIKHLLK